MAYDILTKQRLKSLLQMLDGLLDEYVRVSGGDVSGDVVTFTAAENRDAIASGETLAVTLGKVSKWLSDLHSVAYSGKYNDLVDKLEVDTTLTVEGSAADAKAAGDKVSALNTRVSELIKLIESDLDTNRELELMDIRNGYDGSTYEVAGDAVRAIGTELNNLRNSLKEYIDQSAVAGLYYDQTTYQLYLTDSGGEAIGDPVTIVSGSGGGGSGSIQYSLSFKNLLDDRSLTAVDGMPVLLKFSYSSVDDTEADDGSGVGTLTVNGVKALTFSIAQGDNELNVAKYLSVGDNKVVVRVENSEGSARSITYTVNLMTLSLTTTFDEMGVYSGAVAFTYTAIGDGNKTVHYLMDGVELGTETVATTGKSRTYNIPAQPDGSHLFTMYAELTVGETTIVSNTLRVGMLWTSDSMSIPAILSTYSVGTAVQGENLTIPYMVYDPTAESASVVLSVISPDNSVYSTKTLTVDRTQQEWTVQDYPVGAVKFRLQCGVAVLDIAVTVSASESLVEAITDALVFHFDPSGRSNNEDDPATWAYGDIAATFSDVGFTSADGWQTDSDGASVLKILPGGEVTIPFKPFASDARSNGYTIECEIATHNVRDYDTVVLSCLSGGRGFKIASQYAQLDSEQSSVSMQFKEDEKVRVSFVVEPLNLHRLIYIYVDGIMCGAVQYPTTDNFQQSPSVGLTIGAESSGIDIYRIRMYSKGLTRSEILDNYIADRGTLAERIELAKRNDIFNTAEEIVISKLPVTVPYMVISCAELPTYKGDKKTCDITYVNPSDTARSFTAEDVQIDVQGTSSQGYKKKNWKLKFKNGITYTANNTYSEKYQLRADSVPATAFCMKADVASSEGTNNVELVRLYNDIVPYKTSAQETNSSVRVGIDGLPMIIFWQNTTTGVTRFYGKYNFNFDKSAEEVFGLHSGCESWEFRNNTSNRVIFKSADFTGTEWQSDFEARYPDGNTDVSNLKALCEWVVSTDRDAVTSDTDKATRLQKFKDEFEDHFILDPMVFYYVFTETFLMVDNRAKNFFPTTFDGTHWFPFPYDFDTAIGINNEGQLVFDYDLEDTDKVSGSNVFNGQTSTLWCNLRDAFPDEIKAMYKSLRSATGTEFSFEKVVQRFKEHQAVWVEAIWNEDSWEKYLEPLENDNNASYLTMLQGNKASQREWWLYNGFRYRDSKYQCGDAQSNFVTLRCYVVGDITVTPYSHIHPRIKYGSYEVTERGKRNVPTTLVCPLDKMDDTEVYIYSCDRLKEIGDLSPLQVGYADFSMATKLQVLKLGDGDSGYNNTHLYDVLVGNNELLTSLDVRNCSALTTAVDLSGCIGIEEVLASGSAITGVTLPVGGRLKTLEIPATVTNLTMQDLKQFTTLTSAGFGSLTTLRIENTDNIPFDTILTTATTLNRVRMIGVEWHCESESVLESCINRLKTCGGMDASGKNTDTAVVTGYVHVPSISADMLDAVNDAFPQLVVVVNGSPVYIVRYVDYDNTLLYRASITAGSTVVNPVTTGLISAPTRAGTEDTGYAFRDFGSLPTNVQSNVTVIAQYDVTYRVLFMNGTAVFDTQWVVSGGAAQTPSGTPTKAATAQYKYTFSKWDGSYTNITAPTTINAVFTSEIQKYTVKFYNGTTLLQTVTNVSYGGTASYTGSTPTKSGVDDPENYEFSGWSPSNKNIVGDTSCYAQYNYTGLTETITDTWEEIIAACADGTYKTKYSVGDTKILNLGTEGNVCMQIAGFEVDTKADGSGKAPISWISEQLLATSHRMNPSVVSNDGVYEAGTGSIDGWNGSEMRAYLISTVYTLIPEPVKSAIVTVTKTQPAYNTSGKSFTQTTEDDVWIPSYDEILGSSSTYYGLFQDTNANRIKKKTGSTSASSWWLRSAYSASRFHFVSTSGSVNGYGAGTSLWVALGFST